ncbi:MAG: hypothetical protein EOO09_11825 [Chitinophagaceae bacterium]|nr:MAG: hypothetical protein EOO09_11825 [Chitinophagaceae bacterium]
MYLRSRRTFLRQAGLTTPMLLCGAGDIGRLLSSLKAPAGNELSVITRKLVKEWGEKLLSLQISKPGSPEDGLIISPSENIVHGRIGDTFYPFLHLASATGDQRYLDAAKKLYDWMELTVSQPDGSWLNEPRTGSWKGTTVFTSIALAEAVHFHGHLLDDGFNQRIRQRLRRSGDYIYTNFNMDYGNINYPVAGAYCLSLLGRLMDQPDYTDRGKELAQQATGFFTSKNNFLSGEGNPYYQPSPKGCYSIDLGYNVEESLPSLVLYARLNNDKDLLEKIIPSLRTHAAFMLPDGGWDNSWGTRNYKWTYWGSRTSDGCQPAFALMSVTDPVFYQVALRNTQLLSRLTVDGLLTGGPHCHPHGETTSLHHTFCHLKALVSILDHGVADQPEPPAVPLPVEKANGIHYFEDIQTWLVNSNGFRATVTGYDRNYKDYREGHASGGSMSLLWHAQAGIILSASMNRYQLYEKANMQEDKDPFSIPLTPRIEYRNGGKTFSSVNDFAAIIRTKDGSTKRIRAAGHLVDGGQKDPRGKRIGYIMEYSISDDGVTLSFSHDGPESVRIILPVISASGETAEMEEKSLSIDRKNCRLIVTADTKINLLPTGSSKRVFNFVPGLEAIPVVLTGKRVTLRLEVS